MDATATAATMTTRIRTLLDEVHDLANQRRRIWHDANKAGVTQGELAAAAGVVRHVVYCEIRKHREAALVGHAAGQ